MSIVWLPREIVEAIHDRQIAEHGGRPGIRDADMLESALARPQNLFAYGDPKPDLAALAGAYAFGLARHQAFVKGNKRTSWVSTRAFLHLNGCELRVDDHAERLAIWKRLGAGEISEADISAWIRARLTKLEF